MTKAKLLLQLGAGSLIGATSLAANAVVFGTGINDIEIINRENNYRTVAQCTANPGTCLPTTGAGSRPAPAGYQQVNPGLANNVLVGDVFIGVFASRSVINQGVTTVWNEDNVAAGGIDTFTGYFAQEVKQIQSNVNGGTDRIILGTVTAGDPFGILAAGEVARAWVDNAGLANTAYVLDGLTTTLAGSIASATDGALWASFSVGATVLGTGIDNDGYVYSELDISTPGSQLTNGQFYTAWNLATLGSAYNAGALNRINDPVENVKGGSQIGDPFTTAVDNFFGVCAPGAGTYACNDVVGNGQLTANQTLLSPWTFASEDPLQLNRVPEPGSLALVGAALLGVVAAGRRRRSDS